MGLLASPVAVHLRGLVRSKEVHRPLQVGAHGVPSGTPTPAPYGSERDRRAIPEAIRAPRAGFALGMRRRASSADTPTVAFEPKLSITPRMLRQLKAVELRPDWIAEVRGRTHAQEALASLQIEGRRRNGLMGVGTWRFNPAQGSPEIRAA